MRTFKALVVAGLAIFFLLGTPAPSAMGQQPVEEPPFFSLDDISPSLGSDSAADIFGRIPPSAFAVELIAEALGLASAHNMDALSGRNDWVDPIEPCPLILTPPLPPPAPPPPPGALAWTSTLYFWSVDRTTVGAPVGVDFVPATSAPFVCFAGGEPVPPELQPVPGDGAAGDIFAQLWNTNPAVGPPGVLQRVNIKLLDEQDLGLAGFPGAVDELDALQLAIGTLGTQAFDPNDNDVPDVDVFFSVDPPTATALGFSPADILLVPAGSNPGGLQIYADAASLGLTVVDDVDAMCLMDSDTNFANGGSLLISLASGSPSLGGFSAADVFRVSNGSPFPGAGIQVPFLPHSFLSLLVTDDLDALSCLLGDPNLVPPLLPADFGDAPDNTVDSSVEAYPGVPGQFPSLLNTTNAAVPGNTGPHHLAVNQEWLATPATVIPSTTTESDALIVDNDLDDAQLFIFCQGGLGCNLQIEAIHVGAGSPDGPRYVNALVDLNRDGSWQPNEYVIKDKEMLIPPGNHHSLQANEFVVNEGGFYWVRVTLTRHPLNNANWDGSMPLGGGFFFGETEDHLTFAFDVLDPTVLPPGRAQPPPVKEPKRNFSFAWVPNPVKVKAGVPEPFDLVVRRLRNPVGNQIRATGITLFLGNCFRLGGVGGGIDVDGVAANLAGAIVNRGGKITSVGAHLQPVPAVAGGPPVFYAFLAKFPLPKDHRHDRCRGRFGVDPNGEIVEYDFDLPADFIEVTDVGGVTRFAIDGGSGSFFGDTTVLAITAVGALAIILAGGWYVGRRRRGNPS